MEPRFNSNALAAALAPAEPEAVPEEIAAPEAAEPEITKGDSTTSLADLASTAVAAAESVLESPEAKAPAEEDVEQVAAEDADDGSMCLEI